MNNVTHDKIMSLETELGASKWYNSNIILGIVALLYLIVDSTMLSLGMVGGVSYLIICVLILAQNDQHQTGVSSAFRLYFNSFLWSVAFIAFLQSIEALLFSGQFTIHLITLLQPSALILLTLCITAFLSLFKLSYLIRYRVSSLGVNIRLSAIAIIGAVIITTNYTTPEHTLLTSILLGSYFLLLDVFYEQKRPNIIWLILWTIILGSYVSISIFHIEKNIAQIGAPPILDAFSLFTLVFFVCGLLYIPLAYLNDRRAFLPKAWIFTLKNRSLLRNRIQFSILITLVFCFATIAVVSVVQISSWDTKYGDSMFQREFIQALLNTYVFLFLIGLVISIRLSEYIRNPLIKLGDTMRKAKLSQGDQKVQWDGNDEIADLIWEYNNMIEKLQDNAAVLARSERESAWREMSKQVAHEIKNPLTPMKLSLQHLQHSIALKRDNIEELTIRMSNTLMSQIENLKQIADEFSNFGSLPKTNNRKVLLNDVVETIHDLFRQRSDMDIRLVEPIDDIGAYADKNHLLRILNNLVKNSIQAIPEDRHGQIVLKLYKEKNKAIISVTDNGSGISENMQSKIFRPKFTTKSSGSGLGLAIAANMVDSIGGSIHFESKVNQGTTFFLELPLIRSVYSPELERVRL
jgi:signal transduction histidine kinase